MISFHSSERIVIMDGDFACITNWALPQSLWVLVR